MHALAWIKFLYSFSQNTDSSSFQLVWSLSSDDLSSHIYVLLFHACPSQQPERRHRRRATHVTLLVGGRAYFHARGTVQDLAVWLCKKCEPGLCHLDFPISPHSVSAKLTAAYYPELWVALLDLRCSVCFALCYSTVFFCICSHVEKLAKWFWRRQKQSWVVGWWKRFCMFSHNYWKCVLILW